MKTKHPFILLSCIFLFFMWGFITVLNDILVPHLKDLFSLTYVQAMLIQFCFFIAYGLMSLPAGSLIDKFGYKKALLLGLFISSVGCLFFLPAAFYGFYFLFLIGLFILATGIVILQVSANPYVALLGTEKTASSRLNLAQGFNSLGTTIGPLVGSSLILSVLHEKSDVSGIETLYFCLAALLFLLCIFIAFVKFPNIKKEKYDSFQVDLSKQASSKENIRPIFKYPHLYLGAFAIFCYVGAEVSIGSFLVNFLSQKFVFNIDVHKAGNFVSFYWGLSMIGRFNVFALLLKFRARKLLLYVASCAILLVFLTLLGTGPFIGYTLVSVGFFNSIMFPTIFTLAIAGLDKHTPLGSGIICTAIIGGAIMPLIQGLFADMIGIHYGFFIPLICYCYILFYAYRGSLAYCKT